MLRKESTESTRESETRKKSLDKRIFFKVSSGLKNQEKGERCPFSQTCIETSYIMVQNKATEQMGVVVSTKDTVCL